MYFHCGPIHFKTLKIKALSVLHLYRRTYLEINSSGPCHYLKFVISSLEFLIVYRLLYSFHVLDSLIPYKVTEIHTFCTMNSYTIVYLYIYAYLFHL